MQYTFGGLVLAAFFGMFFGSSGEMDPVLVSYIFWGLIGVGATLHLLVIVRDALCKKTSLWIAGRSNMFARFFHC
ncbi:MAG: hypothetical protein H6964_05305 [Chromatiaceae bacterium]|nr:hypothetical protein [Gammaproteobacteria bacterium]MCP5446398.1 hypothetical protein [Chromatiaceae bacterium]MCB1860767.1 hypothetical protein [Gammaproteobacteria bacterium]MCB1872072.1 hypothetical protein [Gammaproteobacteria bacterium]MCB1880429.1 hypothetical protein [Gammaproteobacteria bacterium]